VLFLVFRYSQGVLFTLALVYMFSGIWARAAYSWSWRRRWRSTGAIASLPEASATQPEPLKRP
jgi:CDP-diacylglycerol--serine O-phosphatidyltransferase